MSGSVPAVGWATTPPTGIGQVLQGGFEFELPLITAYIDGQND
jgi:hypothetical protein